MHTTLIKGMRSLDVGAAAVATVVLVTGCGGSDDSTMDMGGASMTPSASAANSYGPAASGPHNESDVSFATDMIPHHAQALEMASLAIEKATNSGVKALATAIKDAQDPEIRTMSGWLVGWGEEVPTTPVSGMGGMHGSGMMTDEQMQELSKASGAAFDRLWVQMMTQHHEGAVEMAQEELKNGINAEAKALARAIVKAQTAEIATMRELAASLPR